MNREIKFRAWDTEEKEYYYDVEHTYDFFCSGRGCYAESFGEVLNQPDRFIVEQYTGLKDEDGKEIYEGDIVTLNCYWEEVDPRDCCVITFEDGCFRVGDAFENEAGKYLKEYRLVGNIHENPELLENVK